MIFANLWLGKNYPIVNYSAAGILPLKEAPCCLRAKLHSVSEDSTGNFLGRVHKSAKTVFTAEKIPDND